MSFPIIHHNGAFNLWNTEQDKPCFPEAMTKAQLLVYIKANYGTRGLEQRMGCLERAETRGTSHRLYKCLEEMVESNHAGPEGTQMPTDEFYTRFLTLPKAQKPKREKAPRLYTITCVCGISVKSHLQADTEKAGTEGSAHVRRCPGCSFISTPPAWWIHREPSQIPANVQAAWDAEDQKRKKRIQDAANRIAARNKTK